ncbi:uncharacterized protein LOC128993542 [Macrosteles quadrilineatus]|uniref:uncharacterized protein LOC128993542 n=1 Tax=Macrosteles quadrilineatus TaxID=74068 RepID=UPI0023E315A9|nr:uncharacterized protein LOC128993542 [Macrosteles quadrilineatus]
MALQCVCVLTDGQGKQPPQQSRMQNKKGLRDIDLCEIAKRSEDERTKHNDYECHLKGEKRQNLINKLKMYLDDYDDRPVMKGKAKTCEDGKTLGQTGFGPMIKYPGYVDYEHPYFSDPYNKMPALASTVGQRGENPCPPIKVRNWDAFNTQGTVHTQDMGNGCQTKASEDLDGRCRCAERRGEVPTCPAAARYPKSPVVPGDMTRSPYADNLHTHTNTHNTQPACEYICIPLPD